MPMNFPDMESLIQAAEVHKFRKPHEDEAEERYRVALADHVQRIDFVESMEIRTSKGWDRWTPEEGVEMLVRSGAGDLLKDIAGRGTPTATVLADDAAVGE